MVAKTMRAAEAGASSAHEAIRIAPMLATATAQLPRERGFAYEFKWDGYRAILHIENGSARIDSRRLNDVTRQFATVAEGASRVRERHLVLDGEIVALDPDNRPSFGLLQQHLHAPGSGPALRQAPPIVFFAFDILYRDRRSLMTRPYIERREALSDLALEEAGWKVPPYEVDQGSAMVRVSDQLRLEGVVAKRLDSLYVPGTRSRDWLKVKHRRRQEFVIAGWTRGEGGRSHTFGSLLIGHYDRRASELARGTKQKFVYAGHVGTGFDDRTLAKLVAGLKKIERATSPFDVGEPETKGVRWVEPRLVAEVSFSEWTHLGQLRQTSFHGLRTDKEPSEVVKEPIFERTKEET